MRKSHLSEGEAKGATKPPEAASTWICISARQPSNRGGGGSGGKNPHGNVVSGLGLVLVEQARHLLDILVGAGVGRAEDDVDANLWEANASGAKIEREEEREGRRSVGRSVLARGRLAGGTHGVLER